MALSQIRATLPKTCEKARFHSHPLSRSLAFSPAVSSVRNLQRQNDFKPCTHFSEVARPNRLFCNTSQQQQSYTTESTGYRSTNASVKLLNPTPYSRHAVKLAEEALRLRTFGVGGVLLDSQGNVHNYQHNNVLANDCIKDPTAHGERQIISWYLEKRKAGKAVPNPEQMTIVTSLDPCLMCTGAFLASGINVAVVSHDSSAGIDWNSDEKFLGVPEPIRNQAIQQFAYLGLTNGRLYAGPSGSVFNGCTIPPQLDSTSTKVFGDSVPIVHRILDGENPAPLNIADLPADAPQKRILQQLWPEAATLHLDITKVDERETLRAYMELVAEKTKVLSRVRNSAALIDPFDNVLLIMGYGSNATPDNIDLETPFMMLTRSYAECRRQSSLAKDGYLPHPKRCKFVLLNGPGPNALDVMDLGAYGSTLEGRPQAGNGLSLCYFNPTQSPESLVAMIKAFPPLYSQTINISPVQLG